jgi:hypothetical protein
MSSKKFNKLFWSIFSIYLAQYEMKDLALHVYQNLGYHFLNIINLFESHTWYSFYNMLNQTPILFTDFMNEK